MKEQQKDNIKTVKEYFMVNPTFAVNTDYFLMSPQSYEMAIQMCEGGPNIRLFVSEREASSENEKVITYQMDNGQSIKQSQVIELDTIQLGVIIQQGENSILEVGFYPKNINMECIFTTLKKTVEGMNFDYISIDLSNCTFSSDELAKKNKTVYQGTDSKLKITLSELGIEENSIILCYDNTKCIEASANEELYDDTNGLFSDQMLTQNNLNMKIDQESQYKQQNQLPLDAESHNLQSDFSFNADSNRQQSQELNKRRTGEQFCQEIKTSFSKPSPQQDQNQIKFLRGNRHMNQQEEYQHPKNKRNNGAEVNKIEEEHSLDYKEDQNSEAANFGSKQSIPSDIESPNRICNNSLSNIDPVNIQQRGNRKGNVLKRKKIDNSNDSTEENGESAQETEDLCSMGSRNNLIDQEQNQGNNHARISREEIDKLKKEIDIKMKDALIIKKLSNLLIVDNIKFLIEELDNKISRMKMKKVKTEQNKQEIKDNTSEEEEGIDRKGENFSDRTSTTSTQPDYKYTQNILIKNNAQAIEDSTPLVQSNILD